MDHRLVAEIDLAAVRHNVQAIRSLVGPGVGVMAIVKADGYGHGAVEVARTALAAGATWLGIATVSEGIELRQAIADTAIGHLPPFPAHECDAIVAHRLTPFVSDLDGLASLEASARRLGRKAEFHLEVDTGMGRSGAFPDQAAGIARAAGQMSSLTLTGLATHFASAESDPEYTRRQIEIFDRARAEVEAIQPLATVHAANSAGLILYPSARYDLVRPGLLLYGILPALPPGRPAPPVRPALRLRTQIALLRTLAPGQSVSYSRTCVLRRHSRIATLPVGYGDGYPRALSNHGYVLVSGRRAPIVGRVCMDVTLADVTDVPEAGVGTEVVLVGQQGTEQIRVEELASLSGTTEHDITTRLTARVSRVYLNG